MRRQRPCRSFSLRASNSTNAGISLAYLMGDFARLAYDWSGQDDPSFLRLKEVFWQGDEKIGANRLCPRDGRLGCALVDWLPPEHRHMQTHFMSWSWSYSLRQLQSAMKMWRSKLELQEVFFYMCFFVNNQFRIIVERSAAGSDNLEDVFETNLRRIGHVVAVLDTWREPVYLQRVWTIYEQYVACSLKVPVTFVMPESATASLDEEKVKNTIQSTVGFDRVNQHVKHAMIQWIGVVVREKFEQLDRCTIVECCLVRNQNLFRSLASGPMQVLATQDFLGQLLVEASRQRGLSQVISQTLGFEGMEFYIAEVHGIEGWTFGDLLFALGQSIPIGYMDHGQAVLVPSMEYIFSGHEQLICLSEDASTLAKSISPGLRVRADESERTREKVLKRRRANQMKRTVSPGTMKDQATPLKETITVIIGWNEGIGSIVHEVDQAVGADSTVLIYSPQEADVREEYLDSCQVRLNYKYQNVTVEHVEGALGARYKLEDLPLEKAQKLGASSVVPKRWMKIFILADKMSNCEDEADRLTVATLLQVRDILRVRKTCQTDLVILPQVLGRRAEKNCWKSGLIDYINSNRLACQVLAQVCQSPNICCVFAELLLGNTARICIRKLSDYLTEDETQFPVSPKRSGDSHESLKVTFSGIQNIVAKAGEVAIGWSRAKEKLKGQMIWELNPAQWEEERSWSESDAWHELVRDADGNRVDMIVVVAKPPSLLDDGAAASTSPTSPERAGGSHGVTATAVTMKAAMKFRKAFGLPREMTWARLEMLRPPPSMGCEALTLSPQ
eukprot:g29093.t2